LELLKDVMSDISPVMVLWTPDDPPAAITFRETEATARTLGVKIRSATVRGPDDFETAFNFISGERPKSLIILPAPMMGVHAGRLAELALKSRLPSISNGSESPKAGGLMSYGPSFLDIYRQSATYVKKILAGANPAELPVQQPTKFELVINLKTAKALSLTVPPSLLARADEVIE
jgi:putative ABC transport system substrate-binding protein